MEVTTMSAPRKLFSFVIMMLSVTSLFATGSSEVAPAQDVQPDQVFVAAYANGPGGNGGQPAIPFSSAAGHSALLKLYSPLTILSKDGSEIVPFAAESWSSNSDQTAWTFRIRQDMRFSDGRQITAHDVKKTAEYVTDPDFKPENAGDRNLWLNNVVGFSEKLEGSIPELTSVRVVDDYTVEFTLKTPNPRFYANCYRAYILPTHAMTFPVGDPMMTDWWFSPDEQVSSGPFRVGGFQKDEYLELVPNEYFFLGKPQLDRFIIKFFGGDITAAVLAIAAGDVMFSYVNFNDLAVLDADEINVFSGSSDVIVFFDLNYNNLPEYWQDIRFRQALMYAIDRQTIVQQIYKGTAKVYPAIWAHQVAYSDRLNWFEYNPEKAKQLLDDAGINPDDVVIDVQSHAGYNNTLNNAALQAIQQYLAQIGIDDFSYRFLDVPSWRNLYTKGGDWTIGFRGWGVPLYGADPYFQMSNAGRQGGDFRGYDFDNNGFPEVLTRVTSAPTNQEYFGALTELNELHNAQLPVLYMWVETRYGAANTRVRDFHWFPAAGGGPYIDDSHMWYIGQ
jgi:peptide/nickel transport system substrate-binding protein